MKAHIYKTFPPQVCPCIKVGRMGAAQIEKHKFPGFVLVHTTPFQQSCDIIKSYVYCKEVSTLNPWEIKKTYISVVVFSSV